MSARRLTRLVLALLLAGLALGAGGAAAAPLIYKVRSVKGLVLTRVATSARWRAVRSGTELREGQLIQVTAGATVTIEERSRRKVAGMAKDRAQLTISQPTVARLSPDLLREVQLSSFFIDKTSTPEPDAKTVHEPLTWQDAWQRLAAIITSIPPPEAPMPELRELERQGMALSLSAKRLNLIAPASNAVVQTSDWPTELKVVWITPPGTALRYHIYVWPVGTQRPTPVAATERDFHTVKLPKPGSYFVQVTSADGAWQSAAQAVHGIAPLGGVTALSGATPRAVRVEAAMSLRYPPEHFVQAAAASPERVVLAWDADAALGERTFVVTLNDGAGKTLRRLSTTAKSVALQLKPGRYQWSVGIKGSDARTATRQFEILRPEAVTTAAQRRALVRRLLTSGQDATVALDEGF